MAPVVPQDIFAFSPTQTAWLQVAHNNDGTPLGGSLPVVDTVALLASSITAQNGAVSGNDGAGNYLFDALGYWNWANILLGQRFKWVANAGVGSQTSTQVLARLGTDILALSPLPGWCILEGLAIHDVDDVASPDTALAIANMTSIITQLLAAGIRPVLCTITPSSYTTTTAQKQALTKLNEWIKLTAPTLFKGLIVCDWASAMTDPTTGGPNTALFKNESGNYVHPTVQGAFTMAVPLAEALAPVAPSIDVLESDGAGAYNLMPNPYGSGGSGIALPTSWTVTNFDGSAFTGLARTVARRDGIAGSWAEISAANISPGGGGIQLLLQNTNAGTDFVAGTDSIYGYVEFETDDDWANVKNFWVVCEFFNGLGGSNGISARSADGAMPLNLRKGVFAIPAAPIPVGTTRLQLKAKFGTQSGAFSGTFRIARPTVRVVGH